MSIRMPGQDMKTFRAKGPGGNFDDPWFLRNLVNSTKITLLYQDSSDAEPVVLFSHFPKLVAIHFSQKWRSLFPFPPGLTSQEVSAQHPEAITIIGGEVEYHMQLLDWMLRTTDGGGLKIWPEYPFVEKPFYKYFHLRRSAQIIGCVFLEDEFHLRMQALSNKRIHSDDVAAVYQEVDKDSAMAQHLVAHVASFFLDKGLRHTTGPYWRLREELPGFGDAVAAMIGFRYKRDPELAQAWNEHQLAKEEGIEGETVRALKEVKLEDVKKLGEEAEKEEKKEEEQKEEAKEGEDKKKVGVVGLGVDPVEQAMHEASKIKDKNARRREKKRLAKKAAAAGAATAE